MALKNKYDGRCGGCGNKVAAGAGWLQGPPWVTFCVECWKKYVANTKPTVMVTMASATEFVVSPKGFLDDGAFNAYRSATDAAQGKYVKETKQKLVPADAANKLMQELNAAGFLVEVAPNVVAALQAHLATKKAAMLEVSAHLAKVEAGLNGRVLFPFQRTGVEWLTPRANALLADEMGLGKTAQALCALPYGAPVIIVAPVVAKGVWAAEIKMWRPDYTNVSVLAGKGSFRWPEAGEIVITNYEVLPTELKSSAPTGTVIIADEAHMVKNRKAKRTLCFAAVSEAVRKAGGKCWLLTATPLLNTPPELWQVLAGAGLAEEAFGEFKAFAGMFGYVKHGHGGSWGMPSDKVRGALVKVMLRRHRLDVLPDLPTKIRTDVEVNGLDEATKKLCDEVLQTLEDLGINLEAAIDGSEATKIHGAAFEAISKARAALATAKIPAMLEIVEQYEDACEPLVVFSAHRAPIDVLAKREGWAVITGDTAPEERTEIAKRFQAGELKGIGATIRAGGVSITLTQAHHALFCDLAWTPALNSQAEDRICRIGQDKGVIVKRLIATHKLDRRVMELLTKKQILIEASVEAAAVKEGSGESIVAATLSETVANTEAAIEALELAAFQAKRALRNAAAAPKFEPKFASNPKHGPTTPAEKWAAGGLVTLAGMDPDHAATLNGVGFNKLDGEFGHDLAARIVNGTGLTNAQWGAAINMLKKYHGQIGECPAE